MRGEGEDTAVRIFASLASGSPLALIRKGGTIAKDREAIRLLREHDILSMAT